MVPDLLDGTVNFAHGIPFFCVSIAYSRQGLVELGAVYDPMRDEMFTAERGQAAWCNGRRLQVSEVTEMRRSSLATGFPVNALLVDAWGTTWNTSGGLPA